MSLLPDNNYQNILTNLKDKIRQARQRASVKVNYELLKIYWEIGETILVQQKQEGWGTKVTARLAKDLKMEFPDMRGLSERNLVYMQTFASCYPHFPFTQVPLAEITVSGHDEITQVELAELQNAEKQENSIVQGELAQLSWYHHITLLDKVKDKEIRLFYLHETVKNGWSRDVMVHQIESGLHNKMGKLTTNFDTAIAPEQSELVQQVFKDPYKFEFIYLGREAKERDLEDALLNNITKVLLELGVGFALMGRQRRFEAGGRDFFLDLLFYHTKLRRHVIVELKIGDFEPEYVSKMNFYLSIADDQLRGEFDEPSIGIIMCKTKNKIIAEYALRDTTKPIGIAEYKIAEQLPEDIKGELPSIAELEAEIDKGYEELKSPSQKRVESLMNKIASLKGKEIQQIATLAIWYDVIDNCLIPLYTSLIKRMEDFNALFVTHSYSWYSKNKHISKIEDLPITWKDEEYLKSNNDFHFTYRLDALRKAGPENLHSGFQLNCKFTSYWYEFSINNYQNSQPFIKKLYHELFTEDEHNKIVEMVVDFVANDIDRQIEWIKEKSHE